MKQDLQQLEVELIAGHERLAQVTEEVEDLEGKKDYLMRDKIHPEAARQAYLKQPPGANKMILFEKDCSQKFVISQDEIEAIRKDLVVIVGETKIIGRWEAPLTAEGQKQLEEIEFHALHIGQVLEGLKENSNES